MRDNIYSASRLMVLWLTFWLPKKRRVETDRWLRGREEYRKLQAADIVLVSYGKSGRTWLRVMLSRFYQLKFGLSENSFLEFDNLKRRDRRIPSVFFTHGNYIRSYTNNWDNKADFYGKRIILLVRDPRDVAVSQFFQWKHRMLPWKKTINNYPPHGADVSLHDFVLNAQVGLPYIIDNLNGWPQELDRLADVLVIRYEDQRADPEGVLGKIVDFMNTPGTPEEISGAVEYAAYDNMKKLEKAQSTSASRKRLTPGNRSNPDSFKVRRAKVGGYRDYFDEQTVTTMDRFTEERLSPSFGYTGAADQLRSGLTHADAPFTDSMWCSAFKKGSTPREK